METNLSDVLSSNYLLATLNVRIWSGKKTDRNASQELQSDKGTVANAAAVVVKLLAGNDAKLKETQAAFTRIRSYFYDHSSPWTANDVGALKGDRLIGTATSIDFLSEFGRLKNEAEKTLNEFLAEYDGLVARASASLASLYDVSMYPDRSEIGNLFSASMYLRPVPATTDFDRLSIPAALADGLKGLYEKQSEAQVNGALSDLQQRLLKELNRMALQLGKVAAGEKTRLFKSLTGNLEHLVGLAKSLNFTANPEMDALLVEIENNLLVHEVELYKDNIGLSRRTADKAEAIINKVNTKDLWSLNAPVTAPQGTLDLVVVSSDSNVAVVEEAPAITPDFNPEESFF